MATDGGNSQSRARRFGVDSGYVASPAFWVVYASIGLALACLVALAGVARARDADTLATIALVVALVSFIVQFMVFLAQSMWSGLQASRSEQIFHETSSLLTRLEATSTGTKESLDRLSQAFYERASIAVADVAKEAGSTTGVNPDELEDRLLAVLGDVVRDVRESVVATGGYPTQSDIVAAMTRADELASAAASRQIHRVARLLSGQQHRLLRKAYRAEAERNTAYIMMDGLEMSAARHLELADLVNISGPNREGWMTVRLTPTGERVAKTLSQEGRPSRHTDS